MSPLREMKGCGMVLLVFDTMKPPIHPPRKLQIETS